METVLTLAVETSCDETAAAVVRGRELLSNVVASQMDLHAAWGGVVPEAAARAHVPALLPVIERALEEAGVKLETIEAVAVTSRPGLVGALSVGVTAAKALAFARALPLLGVHHIEGHVASVFPQEPPFPLLVLVVSGGHTELLRMESPLRYRVLGATRDDAAGEALDKSARLIGLPYPGGRALSLLAQGGDPKRYPFTRGLGNKTYEMSFSGLKTAVRRTFEQEGDRLSLPDFAASVQGEVVGTLISRLDYALTNEGAAGLAIVGGVAANDALRAEAHSLARHRGVPLFLPPLELCTDNAGMIGLAAAVRLAVGERDGYNLEARAMADLPGIF